MNTLTAIQGTDVAFIVTLSPSTVDFPTAPELIAEVHRGDGRAAVATLLPSWVDTTQDRLSVFLSGTVSATIPAGGYFLSVRTLDNTAYLSYDVLNVLAGVSGISPLRSLVTPAEAVQLLPDILASLPQFTALPQLLATATTIIEDECDRKLILDDYDASWPYPYGVRDHYLPLEYPVASIAGVSVGPAGYPIDPTKYTATTRYDLDSATGTLRVNPSCWTSSEFVEGGPTGRLVRVLYRGGYAVEKADLDAGLEPVPLPLRTACCVAARVIQQGVPAIGPIKSQTVRDRSYTVADVRKAAIEEAAPYINRYRRNWVVA